MPPSPQERDFYEELLAAMDAALFAKLSVSQLRQRVRVLARQLGVRMLIIDEIHSMLSGTFREQRIFLNALRFLANDLRLPLVCVGTPEAKQALLTDQQLADFRARTHRVGDAQRGIAHPQLSVHLRAAATGGGFPVSPRERPALGRFIALPIHLPVAPRPLAGELLSSWLGRLAAASALSFEELLEALRVRSAPSRTAEFYPGRLDYGCSRPLTKALSTLSRWPAARIAALDLKRRFGTLGLWWLNHDVSPFSHTKHRPQVLPSYCAECLREQTLRGEPAHLRTEWALALLTHCPQHQGLLRFCCPDRGSLNLARSKRGMDLSLLFVHRQGLAGRPRGMQARPTCRSQDSSTFVILKRNCNRFTKVCRETIDSSDVDSTEAGLEKAFAPSESNQDKGLIDFSMSKR